MKKIVLTGGGTAGHIYPALALVPYLEKEYQIHYIGGSGMEKDILAKHKNIIYHQIPTVKLERKLTLKNLLIPFKLFSSIKKARKILKDINPEIVFSKGGFVALPVVIGAKKNKTPVLSHESDLSMGLANKIILRFCDKMATAFQATAKENEKCVFTGQPIRQALLHGNKNNLPFYSKMSKALPCLLIVGGSSGAGFLNKIVKENLQYLTEKFNVIHICGKGKADKTAQTNYFQIEYSDSMGDILDAADFVVSRAGSGAINEFLSLNKPMLLIPLSKACSRGDQIENAKLFCQLGYAMMLEEENYSTKTFADNLEKLVKNDNIFKKNMKNSAKNNANEEIIKLIKQLERKTNSN